MFLRAISATAAAILVGSLLAASPFGINGHIPWPEVLDEAAELGVGWIRIDFRWPLVELEQDCFDWQIYDQLVAEAEARGLRLYATIGETPAWATGGAAGVAPPDDPAEWRDFVYRSAARYRGRIHAWGLWNEPNLGHFWAGTRQQFIDEILVAGAEAIRAADPDALVCGPELAHLSSAHWEDWLRDVLQQASGVLDVVTHHIYPDGASHSSVTKDLDRGGQYPWDPPAVKEVLQQEGWFGRPFWLTETGVNADDHGERSQATFYTSLLLDWFRPDRDLWWVDRIFFYQLFDDPRYPELAWGIFGPPPELEPRQAVTAYRAFIASAEVDDAELGLPDPPRFVVPGSAVRVELVARNTGTTTWTADDGYVLGEPEGDRVWDLPEAVSVAPGEAWAFTVGLEFGDEGDDPRTVTAEWRMLRVGQWWFGDRSSAAVVVSSYPPPVIVDDPAPAGAFAGDSVDFRVEAVALDELVFEWFRNGLPLASDPRFEGADTARLTVLQVDRHVTGEYRCEVGNLAGSVLSAPAELRLYGPRRTRPVLEDEAIGAVSLLDRYSPTRYGGGSP